MPNPSRAIKWGTQVGRLRWESPERHGVGEGERDEGCGETERAGERDGEAEGDGKRKSDGESNDLWDVNGAAS